MASSARSARTPFSPVRCASTRRPTSAGASSTTTTTTCSTACARATFWAQRRQRRAPDDRQPLARPRTRPPRLLLPRRQRRLAPLVDRRVEAHLLADVVLGDRRLALRDCLVLRHHRLRRRVAAVASPPSTPSSSTTSSDLDLFDGVTHGRSRSTSTQVLHLVARSRTGAALRPRQASTSLPS